MTKHRELPPCPYHKWLEAVDDYVCTALDMNITCYMWIPPCALLTDYNLCPEGFV